MTDPKRLADPEPVVRGLPRWSGVVLREPDRYRRAALAAHLAPLCRRLGLCLLIADDPALALRFGADGVHWPEAALHRRGPAAGRHPHPRWLVTAAAHSPAALRRAACAGVDAILLSPVMATASHPGTPALGPIRFARFARLSPVPVYALGGIDARAAQRLLGSGAIGYAAIGALVNTVRESRPDRSRTQK